MWWRKSAEYIIIILTAILTRWIMREEGYTPWLSGLLTLNVALVFVVWNRASAIMKIMARVYLGVIFMVSGYVKLVDPMGSMYKFEDYFIALGLDFMIPASLFLGGLLSIAEFLIGFALFFRMRMRFTSWVLILFMALFLPLTLWLALTNAVTDCGCFGDFLILSNMQTFFKNLLFMAPALLIFINRKAYGWRMRPMYHWVSLALVAASALFVSNNAYNHLPLHDFRAWKVGTVIDVPEVPQVYLVYENHATGEQQEWLSSELPWQDSAWVASWSYVSTRTRTSAEGASNYFSLHDDSGVDVGAEILLNPSFQILVIAPDVLAARRDVFRDLNIMYTEATDAGVDMAAATASLYDELEPFRHVMQVMYPFYQADDIILKTVIRSNPGLLLLRDGEVLAKWHFHDFPSFAEIQDEYMKD